MLSSVSPSIVSIGELLWDLMPSGPRLGGATTNFAILSARLGDHVVPVSRLGRDQLGSQALHTLGEVARARPDPDHFDLTHLQCSDQLPTGTAAVTVEPGKPLQYTIRSPAAWDELTLSPSLSQLAASASVVCFGTLAQRCQTSRGTIRAFVESTQPACVRVCDLNLRAPYVAHETICWCICSANVLKISDEELPEVQSLLGVPTMRDPIANAARCAQLLLELAPRLQLVAITLGPAGSLLVDRTREHRHPGFPVQVSDTVGAGDAFTAGLTHASLCGAPLEQISIIANLCGSYVASQPGATPELPRFLLGKIRSLLKPWSARRWTPVPPAHNAPAHRVPGARAR